MDIVKVRFRTNDEFEESFKDDLEAGGLFCPTTVALEEGQQVIIELSAPALPNKVLVRGVVLSWRPALPRLRVRAGAVVEFEESESDKRDFIVETIRGERMPGAKRKHSRLPVAIPVRYRPDQAHDFVDCRMTEISIGGCTLATTEPLAISSEIVLELKPPGAVSPISIQGKATYHRPDGGTGIRFLTRDGGGARRLRELVRRLKQS